MPPIGLELDEGVFVFDASCFLPPNKYSLDDVDDEYEDEDDGFRIVAVLKERKRVNHGNTSR